MDLLYFPNKLLYCKGGPGQEPAERAEGTEGRLEEVS